MIWVPWIHVEKEDTSNKEVKALYKKNKKPLIGKVSHLIRLTSLTPEVADRISKLGKAVYGNDSGLSLREKEIVALVTSSFVGCVH